MSSFVPGPKNPTVVVPYDTIVKYFRYPLDEASKKLGIEKQQLIEMCRMQGIKRWPYRRGMKSVNIDLIKTKDDSSSMHTFSDFKAVIQRKLNTTVIPVNDGIIRPKAVLPGDVKLEVVLKAPPSDPTEKQSKMTNKMSINNILN